MHTTSRTLGTTTKFSLALVTSLDRSGHRLASLFPLAAPTRCDSSYTSVRVQRSGIAFLVVFQDGSAESSALAGLMNQIDRKAAA